MILIFKLIYLKKMSIITKMVEYSCQNMGKTFKQRASL